MGLPGVEDTMTSKVVRLLEQALEAAQEGVPHKGGAPAQTISSMVRKLQARKLKTEMQILKFAWHICLAALKKDEETHFEMLEDLHDLLCEYLNTLSDSDENVVVEPPKPADTPIDQARLRAMN